MVKMVGGKCSPVLKVVLRGIKNKAEPFALCHLLIPPTHLHVRIVSTPSLLPSP